MVLGIAMMATMLPTMIGLNQASQHMRDSEDNRKESSRKQRCHLLVNCSVNQGTTEQREQIHNAMVYVGPENRVSLLSSFLPSLHYLLPSWVCLLREYAHPRDGSSMFPILQPSYHIYISHPCLPHFLAPTLENPLYYPELICTCIETTEKESNQNSST